MLAIGVAWKRTRSVTPSYAVTSHRTSRPPWRARERDRAVTQHEKARRHRRREVQIVEHREHDEAAVAREPDDDVEQRTLMCGIEVHRRLIEEQHVGLLRERHRQDRTLPLTT